ncbi:hypothetical protein AgCh_039489 [Apium graveolens]
MNHISSLQADDGQVVTKHNDLCSLLKEYYTNVFVAPEQEINYPSAENEARVSAEQNRKLAEDLSFNKFTEAIKNIHLDNASGPDGLNPAFFQHFWKLIGKEVYKCCQKWLADGKFSASVNDTNLVLIPKKEKVEEVKDLWPIALCNVLYKIVAKVLANRLQKILAGLNPEEQNAFVHRCNITDNVLVVFELIHYIKRKFSGDVGDVALKLDISKAYDRGSNIGPILPKRGLLQGDPLSPYLFLLCVEVLSLSLKSAANNASISGCRICSQAPSISHLLFADYNFLFFKATANKANSIKEILSRYELLSGQEVNYHKCNLFELECSNG